MRKLVSSFWLHETSSIMSSDNITMEDMLEYHSAISNFVHLITNKNLSVRFHGAVAKTDGTDVTISVPKEPEHIDSVVGEALHEASHCVYTNFDVFDEYRRKIKRNTKFHEKFNDAGPVKWEDYKADFHHGFKLILNVIEDRRIDSITKRKYPGYVPYYDAIYDRYFVNNEIVRGAIDNETYLNKENWTAYEFYIINVIHPEVTGKELQLLNWIFDSIDVPHIDRFKDTASAAHASLIIMKKIAIHLNTDQAKKEWQKNCNQTQDLSGNDNGSGNGHFDSPDNPDHGLEDIITGFIFGEGNHKENQNDPWSESSYNTANDLIAAGVTIHRSGTKVSPGLAYYSIEKTTVHKYKNIKHSRIWNQYTDISSYIYKGIAQGKQLASKLKLRTEDFNDNIVRQKSGRIESRLLSELGFGNTKIFTKTMERIVQDAFIHITIDASSSMSHQHRWERALQMAVTIASAASQISGIGVQISARWYYYKTEVIILYDSRRGDNINTIRKVFPHLKAIGSTPEGLAFEAIIDDIAINEDSVKKLFINLSDGMPNDPHTVIPYTEKVINHIRNMGFKIVSYFIAHETKTFEGPFKRMYGRRNSYMIDETEINKIAKTINDNFLGV